jgi:putative oxidoreductase
VTRWLNSLQPWGVVLLRYVLGFTLLYHGWGKVVPAGGFHGHNTMAAMDGFCKHVAALGVPYWMGYVAIFAEVVGGVALLIGLFVRFFALLAAGDMAMAIALVTWRKGYDGSEYPIALLAIAVMLLVAGPGRWAMDRRMGLI